MANARQPVTRTAPPPGFQDSHWDDWRLGYEVVADDGYARAFVRERGTCPRCDGVGRIEIREQGGATRVGRCRCRKVVDACAIWNSAEVPARHAHCTLETFKAELPGAGPGHSLARAWLKDFDPRKECKGLVLEGEPGRGKTHLLCGILRELVFRHQVEAQFIEFSHLLSLMKESFDKHGGAPVRLTLLTRTPVLAIDELGKGRKTDWEIAVIDEIVSRSYNRRNVLLGTTNFAHKPPPRPASAAGVAHAHTLAQPGTESLEDRLGERVFSRLREMVTFAAVKGDDFRGARR